jgi:hypothetical protein
MQLYTAFDLHSNNSYLGIMDENGKRVYKRKLANDPAVIIETIVAFCTLHNLVLPLYSLCLHKELSLYQTNQPHRRRTFN